MFACLCQEIIALDVQNISLTEFDINIKIFRDNGTADIAATQDNSNVHHENISPFSQQN